MRTFGISQARGRRAVPRTEASLKATLSMPGGDYLATIIDISRTGARVSGEVLPVAGQQITFRAENVSACADVVWSELGACALEFDTPIAISEVQRLRWLGVEAPPIS